MGASGYSFFLASWPRDRGDIQLAREQGLPPEWLPTLVSEEADRGAWHVTAYDGAGRLVGAGRMQPDGRVDYVTVLRPWRYATVGGALLAYLLHIAEVRRMEAVYCEPPDEARRFFGKNGFVATADAPGPLRLVRVIRPGMWRKPATH
jgi:GNAT superfamily N-acetyltransferase